MSQQYKVMTRLDSHTVVPGLLPHLALFLSPLLFMIMAVPGGNNSCLSLVTRSPSSGTAPRSPQAHLTATPEPLTPMDVATPSTKWAGTGATVHVHPAGLPPVLSTLRPGPSIVVVMKQEPGTAIHPLLRSFSTVYHVPAAKEMALSVWSNDGCVPGAVLSGTSREAHQFPRVTGKNTRAQRG